MFTLLRGGLGNALRTKVGLAVIGAMLLGGGGTAMALATAHAQLPFGDALSSAAPTTTASKDDQDDQKCASGANATPAAHTESNDDSAHDSEHKSGTPSATKAAATGSDEANEHESSQDDQEECGKSTATHTPHPEPTERPEGTHTARPTPTNGPGGGD